MLVIIRSDEPLASSIQSAYAEIRMELIGYPLPLLL
jgi:hypothetical protein